MITKDNNFKVIEIFFKHPNQTFHIRELSRLTGLSSTGIIKIVKKLKKEKLLTSRKGKVTEDIRPDFNGKFLLIKRLYNLFSISDSGLLDFIKSFYEMPQAIILFGSYADGTDTEQSDIDIAIITGKKNAADLAKFEKNLARKISLHITDLEKATKGFKNSLANGIVLEGFVELA